MNRLVLRGALAAAIAIAITTVLSLQRPYWVIMIAVVLVNQTTGQSLQKASDQLAATFAGFGAGWALEWITLGHHWLQFAVMMAAVFLAVFFRQAWGRGSYPWMVFCTGLYVVFLFALLGEWSPTVFAARIYNTCLGGAAAIAATVMVRSPGSRERLREEAEDLWNHCRQALFDALADAGSHTHQHPALLSQLDQLRAQASNALYETFLRPSARRSARENFARAEMLCYFVLGVVDALSCAGESAERLRGPMAALLEPVHRACFSDFAASTDRPAALESALAICRSEQVRREDEMWAIPALYYCAALAGALDSSTPNVCMLVS